MRKNKVYVAAAVLLTAALAASLLAGCDFGKRKTTDETVTHSLEELRIPGKTPALSLAEIPELEGYDLVYSPDDFGLLVASRTEGDGGTGDSATDWILYDLAKDRVAYRTTDNKIRQKTDGLYYTKETDSSGGDPVEKTTFFGRNDPSVTVEGEPVYDDEYGDVVTLPGDRRLYVDVNGRLRIEENPVENILSGEALNHYSGKAGAIHYDFDDGDGMLETADLETGTTRRVCLSTLFGVSANAEPVYSWAAGGSFFVQYRTKLPDDAQVYDVFDSGKYDVDTFVYDLRTGDASAAKDFNFIVNGAYDGERFAILSGNCFVNGSRRAGNIVQSFDANGRVFVDLQKVWPGMSLCVPGADGWFFCADEAGNLRVYNEGRLIKETNGGIGSATFNPPFVLTPNALYGMDLEKIADLDEGETIYEICGDTVITEKTVDTEKQYYATTYKTSVGENGKIVVNKSERHERVLPEKYTGYYLAEADTGLFDLYDGSRIDPVGRIEAADIGVLDMDSVWTDGDEMILISGLYRDGESPADTPVYYVLKAA